MVKVVLTTTLAQKYSAGQAEVEVEASNVREMVRALEAKYAGLGQEINEAMAIALDGEILPDPFLEPVRPDSEVFILPKIGGG